MTELILIRHGETDWNRELRFQGQLDVPLNAVGLEQAQRVAERLASSHIDALLSSDLRRAWQTAEIMARQRGAAEVVRAPGLREQHFGEIEGLSVPEVRQRHPQAWAQWLRFDECHAFAGGECTRDFSARVLACVHELAQTHKGQIVAMVTHGGVLDMLYRNALGLPLSGPRLCEIPNAGINRMRLRGRDIEILDWADTRHLADLPPQPVYDQRKLLREHLLTVEQAA